MKSECFNCVSCGRATTYIGLTERQRNTCEDCYRDSGGYIITKSEEGNVN